MHVKEALSNCLDILSGVDGTKGIPSGFPSLDLFVKGWRPGDLILLASRPGLGKTTFALNIARNAAVEYDTPAVFFSLDSSSTIIAKRLLAAESGLDLDVLYDNPAERQYAEETVSKLSGSGLFIETPWRLAVSAFESRIAQLVREQGIALAVVDYISMLRLESKLPIVSEEDMSSVLESLKEVAGKYHIAIILVSQLYPYKARRSAPDYHYHPWYVSAEAVDRFVDTVIMIENSPSKGHEISPYGLPRRIAVEKSDHGSTGYAELMLNPVRGIFTDC